MGDAMTELQARRSTILNMESENGAQVIRARTPLAELDKFLSSLRSISQGRAKVKSHFSDYAPVSADLQKRIAEEFQKTEIEELH